MAKKLLVELPDTFRACGDCDFSHNPLTDENQECDPNKCPLVNAIPYEEKIEQKPTVKSNPEEYPNTGEDKGGK